MFGFLFQLPLKLDIIKHPSECDGKSTSAHAGVLAPDDVTIYTYPTIPEFSPHEKVRHSATRKSSVKKYLVVLQTRAAFHIQILSLRCGLEFNLKLFSVPYH